VTWVTGPRVYAKRVCIKIEADLRPETKDTDASVIERLLARDEAAFADLVAAHHSSLLRLALTFVSDHGAAEEVVQETWLGVIKGLPSFERRSSLKTWIFRILVNRARTRGGRDGRLVNFSMFGDLDDEPSGVADRFSAEGRWLQPPSIWHEHNPEELLLRRELADWLQDAISSLPANQRAVISLRDIEGVEAPEVCNILGIRETNQRVLLHRARTRVRAALESNLKRR
jgi:RNA polymerase sigma-70 factor (ECF subfamily)